MTDLRSFEWDVHFIDHVNVENMAAIEEHRPNCVFVSD